MARRVDLGTGPVNATERDIVRRLVDELPATGWTVIPNASLPEPRTGHAYEYDAIVVGPHAIYVVEVKGWRGTLRELSRADWMLEGGRVERNPLPLADQKARVLASHLRKAVSGGRPPYVQACLVCGSDDATYEVYGMDARRCLRPSELVPYLLDPGQLASREGPADHRAQHDALVKLVTGPLEARRSVGRRYGSYLTTSLQERDEERAVWLGRHALLDDGRVVRIRAWYLSSYQYTDTQRAAERERLMRAAQALSRVGDHPRLATLRDFGEENGEFFEVTDWSLHGTLQTAFVKGAVGRMGVDHRVQLLRDLAEALDAAQRQGVFHRALSPEAVLLDADGRARLTGFDLAFLEGSTSTVYGRSPHPHAEFLPPELRQGADSEVFDNSDLYSLAKLARFLWGDAWPPPVGALLQACLSDDPSGRPSDPAAFLAGLQLPAPVPSAPPPPPVVADGPPTFAPGDVIDGVNVVLGVLGWGSSGTVYRVTNEPLGAEVALKLVTSPPEGYDPAAEHALLRRLDSPHVPRVHWLGRLAGAGGRSWPYLLLDLVDGERLSDLVRRGPIPVDRALQWVDDLLEALAALHVVDGRGAFHRDVKGDNVVVGPAGAVLVDFGSARGAEGAGASPEGTLRTSPPDLAATGWQPQADVYAAACVAHELLAGTSPFPHTPTADTPPPRLELLRPEVPRAVAEVLARALAPRAADRFPDAPALRRALAEAREHAARPKATTVGARATLAAAVDEAGDVLWTAARVQALAHHPDLAVPLAQALLDCVVPPVDETPEAVREALLASEARAQALERPLPEAMAKTYDALVAGLAPAPLDGGEEGDSAAHRLDAEGGRLLWAEGLHFTEWGFLRQVAAQLGREVSSYAWAAAPAAELGGAFREPPVPTPVSLPPGDRSTTELGACLVARRRRLEEALLNACAEPGLVWVGAGLGLVYLGHGLRRDVGEGLDDRSDEARAAWARAFPSGRSGPSGPALPCRLREPTRAVGKARVPVGRLMWPDPPGTPWLQSGGASLPERVLLLFRLEPRV